MVACFATYVFSFIVILCCNGQIEKEKCKNRHNPTDMDTACDVAAHA